VNPLTSIQVFAGHELPLPEKAEWSGALRRLLALNRDMEPEDVAALKRDLKARGFHRLGGGAAQAFTIATAAFVESQPRPVAKTVPERMAETMIELAANGRIVDAQALRQAGFTSAEIEKHGIDAADRATAHARGELAEAA